MPEEALPIRVYKSMPADWMNDGFRRALSRVRSAGSDTSGGDAREIVIALFDASSWAAAIAESRGLNSDVRVQGLRYVRDRLLHGKRGTAAPVYLGEEGIWRWDRSEHLPPPTGDHAEPYKEFYDRHLADLPVVEIFEYFDGLLAR